MLKSANANIRVNQAAGCGRVARDFAYFLSNLSTRPAVSISFCFPVKNGWQLEQISTRISPL